MCSVTSAKKTGQNASEMLALKMCRGNADQVGMNYIFFYFFFMLCIKIFDIVKNEDVPGVVGVCTCTKCQRYPYTTTRKTQYCIWGVFGPNRIYSECIQQRIEGEAIRTTPTQTKINSELKNNVYGVEGAATCRHV